MKKGTTEMTLAELRTEHKKSLKRLLAFEKRNHSTIEEHLKAQRWLEFVERQLVQCLLNEKEVA